MDLVLKKFLVKSMLHNQSTILASLIKLMWMGYQYFIMIVPIPFENVALFPVERKSKKKGNKEEGIFFILAKHFFPLVIVCNFSKFSYDKKPRINIMGEIIN